VIVIFEVTTNYLFSKYRPFTSGRAIRVVYDDTHQVFFGSCVKFSQSVVAMLKNAFRK